MKRLAKQYPYHAFFAFNEGPNPELVSADTYGNFARWPCYIRNGNYWGFETEQSKERFIEDYGANR